MPAPLKVATPSDTDVVVTRTFDALRDLVWRAHTEPKLVKKWLLGPPGWTMPICEIDFRVRGRYRYGWSHPSQPSFEMTGTFTEIKPPARSVHVEEFRGMEATITTVFAEQNGRTTLTLTMHFPSKAARDGAIKTGMTDGMEQSYQKLDQLVAAKTVA